MGPSWVRKSYKVRSSVILRSPRHHRPGGSVMGLLLIGDDLEEHSISNHQVTGWTD
jgi:hypothetical protein